MNLVIWDYNIFQRIYLSIILTLWTFDFTHKPSNLPQILHGYNQVAISYCTDLLLRRQQNRWNFISFKWHNSYSMETKGFKRLQKEVSYLLIEPLSPLIWNKHEQINPQVSKVTQTANSQPCGFFSYRYSYIACKNLE